MRILVTGVRGKTGDPLAELLLARPGVEVLGGSSDPATVTRDGVRPVAFSWDDPGGWGAALEDVAAVYVVRPDRADAPELVATLLAHAPSHSRVVLLSEQDADQVGPDGWAVRVERVVRESGRAWTILRPSWFMQVFTDERFYRDELATGELAFPAGDATLAWVDARDIAAVADVALVEDGHAGKVHEITGPEAITLPATARKLADLAGRPVTHRDVAIEEAVQGLEGFERELTVLTFERVRAGVFSPVSGTVEAVTGRPPRSLSAFLAETSVRSDPS